MGHLSPLDGIGPDDIGLDRLEQRLRDESMQEVILATNPTVEGEATANYIAELCAQYGVEASRIAHGVPVGGELEMVDGTTLSHSLAGRHKIRFNQTEALLGPPLENFPFSPHLPFNGFFTINNGIVEVDLDERTRNSWFSVRG